MATIDDLIVTLSAQDKGVSEALGKIIQLLNRIDQAVNANNKLLRSMEETSKKTNDTMDKAAKNTAESTKRMSDAGKSATAVFKKLQRQLMSLIGAAAMFSLGKKMVNDITKKDMEIGELSRLTNRTVRDVEGLQNAWRAAGRTAQEARQALASYSQAVTNYKLRGTLESPLVAAAGHFGRDVLRSILFNSDGSIRKYEDAGYRLADVFIKKHNGDKNAAEADLISFGISADQVEMFVHKGQAFIEQKKAEAKVTEESIKNAEKFNQVWQEMLQKIEALERELVMKMYPYIEKFIQFLTELADEFINNKEAFIAIAAVVGIAALAFAAVTNPIGTAIAGIGLLLAALWKATNKFDVIKRLWAAIVMMVKESFNGVQKSLVWVFRKLGYDDLADKIDEAGYLDTSEEERTVSAPESTSSSSVSGSPSSFSLSSYLSGNTNSFAGQGYITYGGEPIGMGVGGGMASGANGSLMAYTNKNMGRAYSGVGGGYDCSTFTREAMQNMIKNNPDLFDAKDASLFAGNSGGQINAVAKRTGGMLSQDALSPSNIKEGLLIGMDTGNRGFDRNTFLGMDHIVMTIRGADGRIYVAENSSGRGVHTTLASDWVRRWSGRAKLYIVDTGRLAKRGGNRGGIMSTTSPSVPSITAGASTSINTTGVKDTGNKDVRVSRVIYCETPQQAAQILGLEYKNAKRVMTGE